MWTKVPFRTIHVAALCLCAIFLPWSTAFLSMAQMLLAANWLVWGGVRKDLGQRFRTVFASAPALVFLSFFGLHVLGLAWTSAQGMPWGLDLVRILVPVLSFGVVLAGSDRLTAGELRTILLFGAWSVVVSAAVCILFVDPGQAGEYRSLSRFISHIRLTLLLCFAVVVFVHYSGRGLLLAAHLIAVTWAVYSIDRLGSIQGFIILAVVGAVLLWRALVHVRPVLRYPVRAIIILLPVAGALSLWNALERTYRLPEANTSGYGEYTAGGESYTFDATNPQLENGEHVWAWIAWGEVNRTWARRSSRPLDGTDAQGHSLRGTLVRYMTSKGLRKDSVSLMSLTDEEIHAIEQGRHNASVDGRSKVRDRFDEVMFEIGQYRAYRMASGHSVTMRIEFLRTGVAIAARNWSTGVGTGDTQQAFDEQYVRMESSLAPEWRLRAHNEYLTLFIGFGAFGLLWCMFTWWWPAYRHRRWSDPLFIAWAVIFGISCLTDDTVETQAGATFFALYYTLLVFGAPRRAAAVGPAAAAPAQGLSHAPAR